MDDFRREGVALIIFRTRGVARTAADEAKRYQRLVEAEQFVSRYTAVRAHRERPSALIIDPTSYLAALPPDEEDHAAEYFGYYGAQVDIAEVRRLRPIAQEAPNAVTLVRAHAGRGSLYEAFVALLDKSLVQGFIGGYLAEVGAALTVNLFSGASSRHGQTTAQWDRDGAAFVRQSVLSRNPLSGIDWERAALAMELSDDLVQESMTAPLSHTMSGMEASLGAAGDVLARVSELPPPAGHLVAEDEVTIVTLPEGGLRIRFRRRYDT